MDTNKRRRKKEEELTPAQKAKKEILSWLWSLLVAAATVFLLYTFVFMLIRVDGNSMDDTLVNNERLFVTVADMKLGDPARGDIVITHYPGRGSTFFVKRVVGVPGDQVERVDRETFVIYQNEDGETVRESLGIAPSGGPDYAPYTLGAEEYFLVGDNRPVSHDSRDWNDNDPSMDVGPVPRRLIVGRARAVIWPLNRIRGVE